MIEDIIKYISTSLEEDKHLSNAARSFVIAAVIFLVILLPNFLFVPRYLPRLMLYQ